MFEAQAFCAARSNARCRGKVQTVSSLSGFRRRGAVNSATLGLRGGLMVVVQPSSLWHLEVLGFPSLVGAPGDLQIGEWAFLSGRSGG